MAGTFAAWRSRGGEWRPHAAAWHSGDRRPPVRGAARRTRDAARPVAISARQARREARREAWRDGDLFLDITVIVSVVIFLVLATGVGILALQTSLH